MASNKLDLIRDAILCHQSTSVTFIRLLYHWCYRSGCSKIITSFQTLMTFIQFFICFDHFNHSKKLRWIIFLWDRFIRVWFESPDCTCCIDPLLVNIQDKVWKEEKKVMSSVCQQVSSGSSWKNSLVTVEAKVEYRPSIRLLNYWTTTTWWSDKAEVQ